MESGKGSYINYRDCKTPKNRQLLRDVVAGWGISAFCINAKVSIPTIREIAVTNRAITANIAEKIAKVFTPQGLTFDALMDMNKGIKPLKGRDRQTAIPKSIPRTKPGRKAKPAENVVVKEFKHLVVKPVLRMKNVAQKKLNAALESADEYAKLLKQSTKKKSKKKASKVKKGK